MLRIERGVRDAERMAVAQLYWMAFERKLTPLLAPPARAVPLIAAHLDCTAALVARSAEGVCGVVGFHHERRRLIRLPYRALIQTFGWFAGTRRYLLGALLSRAPRTGELLLDGITVAPEWRSQGVGTRLLEAIAAFGRRQGYHVLRLEVVDTNPAARRLYERMGFTPGATAHYPFMQPFGFTAVTTMRRRLTLYSGSLD